MATKHPVSFSFLCVLLTVVLAATQSFGAHAGSKTLPQTDDKGQGAADAGSTIVPLGTNFLISADSGRDAIGGKPAISFDGTNFFLVWRDSRNYATNGYDVYGARVALDGTVLDPNGIPISTYPNYMPESAPEYVPSVAFDGTNYTVVWVENRQPEPNLYYQVFAARVTPSGTVLDPQGVPITLVPPDLDGGYLPIRMPSIAFDGTNYLVVWRTGVNTIRGTRVSQSAQNLDGAYGFLIRSSMSYYPYVAFDGTNYMVVWHDSRNDGTTGWDVYGARVSKAGAVLDPDGFLISNAPQNQEHTAIAFDGTNYLVAWYDWRPNNNVDLGSLYAARVSPNGTVLDNPAFQVSSDMVGRRSPRISFDGTDYLVAWTPNGLDIHARLADSYGRRISTQGTLLDDRPIPIGIAAGHQWGPVTGFGSGRYLVVWNESHGRCHPGCIYGQLLQRQTVGVAIQSTQPKGVPPSLLRQTSDSSADPWIVQTIVTATGVLDVWGTSATNVYAMGMGGEVFHYRGNAWSYETTFPIGGPEQGMWGTDPNNIWSVGQCWALYHYDGVSWNSPSCSNVGAGMAIWGQGSSPVLAVGTWGWYGLFDGTNWRNKPSGVTTDLWDVWGSSPTNAYAISEFGRILHYDGTGWQLQSGIPTIQGLNAIWGTGPNNIFVVGDFGTILHYNGSVWELQESGTRESLFGVWGLNPGDIYAVGLHGTIVHYDGSAWQKENSGVADHLFEVWGTLDRATRTYSVWAVGMNGKILRKTGLTTFADLYLPIIRRGN